MNQYVHPAEETDDILGLETGLEALQASSTFHGPVEPVTEHHSYDHLAFIYESQAEQFATAIPYIKHGLESGERCIYIADENDTDEILEALREAGVDVDDALASESLVMYTAQDAYLRNGAFDPDDMIAFISDVIEEGAAAYEGVRITGEMTWVFGEDPPFEELIEYEGKLNRLMPDANGIALCQYNREQFSPELIRDIIKTHPHLIYRNTVCQNFYYTPPEEFFGPDQPEREIDRMIGTLLDRTEARVELQEHRKHLERQNEITGDPDRSFEEKLQDLFELGCDRFGLEVGGIARLDPANDRVDVEIASDDHEYFDADIEVPLSETFCAEAIEAEGTVSVSVAHDPAYETSTLHRECGLEAYLGTAVEIEGGHDRTLFFLSSEPREEEFSDDERAFHHLMAQWVQYELQRDQREHHQQTLYEIAADPDRSFDDKLEAMFDLGCERFDLEQGGLARVETATESLKVEAVGGEADHFGPGTAVPLAETYCRRTTDSETTVAVTDPKRCGLDDTRIYREFDIETYLGARIELENGSDRTLFFVAQEGRDREFSDAERTFHRLMTQWVQYELEERARERQLRESEQRYRTLIESFPNGAVALFDDDCRYTAAGGELIGDLGLDRAEIVGQTIYDRHPDELVSALEPGFRAALEGEETSLEVNSHGRELQVYTHPITVCDETHHGMLVIQDITDRKEYQRKLEASNERLTQFAYAASHDLQEPLRMVTSYLQLLESRYGDAFDDDGEEFLEFAVDGADRMREMIDGLLEYSRVETQGDPFEPMDLNAILEEVLEDLQLRIEETDATITTEELPRIEGDASQLRQLFQNLLDNAITYSGDEPPRVHVEATREDQDWVLSVRDEGIGIDPDDQDRVFTVFDRLHSREEYEGTGIGLALCQRIVERHGGDIWVDSEPGVGATFSFTLPAAPGGRVRSETTDDDATDSEDAIGC